MVEVVGTDEFESWFLEISPRDQDAVAYVVDILELRGVALGYPLSSAIKGSRYPLRELRIQSGGHPLRVFYVFDPRRQAVLLIGGEKTGDDRFYEKYVRLAEDIFDRYLKER